jgi:hypothetical protein
MVELRKHAKVIEEALAKEHSPNKNFADYIDENQWLDKVVKDIDKTSWECAREFQKEIGLYPKPTTEYTKGQPPEVAPPTRLLCLNLILSYWLGWVMTEKHGDGKPVFSWDRIQDAYMAGRDLSKRNERP